MQAKIRHTLGAFLRFCSRARILRSFVARFRSMTPGFDQRRPFGFSLAEAIGSEVNRRASICSHWMSCSKASERFLQKMKAVSDLDGVWGSSSTSCRIKTTPISRDDLDSWMSLKPAGEPFGGSIREQINNCILLQIH